MDLKAQGVVCILVLHSFPQGEQEITFWLKCRGGWNKFTTCVYPHVKSGTDEGLCAKTSAIYINHQHLCKFYTKENYYGNRSPLLHNQVLALVASGTKTSWVSRIDVTGTPLKLLISDVVMSGILQVLKALCESIWCKTPSCLLHINPWFLILILKW